LPQCDISSRCAYVEAAAAIAQARRLGLLTRSHQRTALTVLEAAWSQMPIVEVDHTLMRRAGARADAQSLRGYDATHCAGAESINDAEVVAASGERQLLAAWRLVGVDTVDVKAELPGR
jgi:uncharacterized protein